MAHHVQNRLLPPDPANIGDINERYQKEVDRASALENYEKLTMVNLLEPILVQAAGSLVILPVSTCALGAAAGAASAHCYSCTLPFCGSGGAEFYLDRSCGVCWSMYLCSSYAILPPAFFCVDPSNQRHSTPYGNYENGAFLIAAKWKTPPFVKLFFNAASRALCCGIVAGQLMSGCCCYSPMITHAPAWISQHWNLIGIALNGGVEATIALIFAPKATLRTSFHTAGRCLKVISRLEFERAILNVFEAGCIEVGPNAVLEEQILTQMELDRAGDNNNLDEHAPIDQGDAVIYIQPVAAQETQRTEPEVAAQAQDPIGDVIITQPQAIAETEGYDVEPEATTTFAEITRDTARQENPARQENQGTRNQQLEELMGIV